MAGKITAGMLSPLYHDFPTSMLIGIAGASPLSALGRSAGMLSFCAETERATLVKTKSKKSLIKRDITEKLGIFAAKLQTSLHMPSRAATINLKSLSCVSSFPVHCEITASFFASRSPLAVGVKVSVRTGRNGA